MKSIPPHRRLVRRLELQLGLFLLLFGLFAGAVIVLISHPPEEVRFSTMPAGLQ